MREWERRILKSIMPDMYKFHLNGYETPDSSETCRYIGKFPYQYISDAFHKGITNSNSPGSNTELRMNQHSFLKDALAIK